MMTRVGGKASFEAIISINKERKAQTPQSSYPNKWGFWCF
ncbi:hypothetical protein JCM19233_6379 [Vibrio astriarenae]|nr:hypothetical protein JCM19233_6379 [Vibrio sp. C7]